MGDFGPPKRRDVTVMERLKRRFEVYRQHQNGCVGRFEPSINGRYDQCRQETQLLHQRWLESKEKKAGKQAKTNKDSNPLSEQRNLVLSQKLKRKLGAHQASDNSSVDCGPYSFNDDPAERPVLKKRAGGVDLSVQIVQQINSQPEHSSRTIETNVTVSSTLKPFHDNGNTSSPHHPSSTSIRTSTSVECKQEPLDDNHCVESQGGHPGFNPEFEDDLQALLETLEKEGGLSEDILNDLAKFEKFDDVCYKVSNDSKDSASNDSMNVLSPGPPKGTSPAVQNAQSGNSTPMSQMYDVNQNMDSLQSSVPMGQFRNSSQSQMSGLAETGRAAETLKQMAAHHQNQQPPPAYGPIKSSPLSPFPDPLHEERYIQPRNGFANYQQQGYSALPQQTTQNTSMYPYNQQVNTHVQMSQQVQQKDGHLTYGRTKPLSHFPDPMASQANQGQSPSSLQQLQNQVRAQFSNAPTTQMQISQSQQMQMSQGHQRMQMSQSQQMQMQQPPHQFSMSQQQSFSMGPNIPQNQAQFVNDPVKMQMYQEKMRQEQQHQQQQQQQLIEHQRRAQMQQYMNRPPPEYKMQGSVNTSSPAYPVNGGSMGPSPLQTMQNMVNQTNTLPGYAQVKSEVNTMNPQNAAIQAGSVHGVQSMTSAGVAVTQGMHPDMVPNNTPMDSYTAQQIQQRQQMFKQSQMAAAVSRPVSVNMTRAPRPAAPTYSSTIMRNQRPPNVNVGPDGLNISQPRNPVEWSRPMLNSAQQRHPGPPQGAQMNRGPAPTNIMSYAPYSNTVAGMQMQQQRTGQVTAMQGQNGMMQNNAQSMMQQMSQHMVMRQTGSSPYPVNSSNSLSNPAHPQTAPNSFSVPTSQAEFPLDFLDTSQSTNSDFFETMVQSTNSSDFAILDEILGK